MQNNQFPTLTQITPTRWEGDGRIIQVIATGIGYAVTVGTTEYSLGNAEQVQRLISNALPIEGYFVPAKNSTNERKINNSYTLTERSITVPRSKKNAW